MPRRPFRGGAAKPPNGSGGYRGCRGGVPDAESEASHRGVLDEPDIADLPDARGDRGRAQREAVQEALPVLLPLLEDDDKSVRWAAGELQRICAEPTAQ
ncbi:HEAT repeat domain-containing protein [Streptomyces sp. NPDC001922]|uniref:HEAT repeat domain-containing protein n=1 Tax=Streptomyces sp. NPDC001922 TaxID=3364624 RepID=UPI00368924E9